MRNHRGVTLVETAISLTVVGLLVASTLVGKTVYKQAQLRNVAMMFRSYETAVVSFKTQYRALPGDIANAHRYWDNGANTICGTAAQCNGDASGVIDWSSDANANEFYRGMQHLSLARLVPDSFSGVGNVAVMGSNVGNAYGTRGAIALGSDYLYSASLVNAVTVGGVQTSAGWPAEALFTPNEAVWIEQKMDDGLPALGKVITARSAPLNGVAGRCVDQSIIVVGATVNWLLEDTTVSCRMFFRL